MEMETRGLGAGSYPDAPDIEEDTGPVCSKCGDPRELHDLREVDGELMCRWCLEDYYLDNCRDKYWGFIKTPEQQYEFSVKHWFLTLEPKEQARIALEAFQREFSGPFPQRQNLRDEIIRDYMEISKSDFADYIESKAELRIKRGAA